MTYYPYWYRLGNADAYLIWYDGGNEADGVFLDKAGCLLTFRSLAELRGYAERNNMKVEPEVNPAPLDFDCLLHWLETARKNTVDCKAFLDAWNLFSDIASTVQNRRAHIDDQKENRIYAKLFYGNNIPAMTPPGRHYEPIWTKSEVGRMRNVLGKGMQLFRERLVQQPN